MVTRVGGVSRRNQGGVVHNGDCGGITEEGTRVAQCGKKSKIETAGAEERDRLGPPGIIRGKKMDTAELTIIAVSIRPDDEVCRWRNISGRREGRTIRETRIEFIRRRGATIGGRGCNPGCDGCWSTRLMKADLFRDRNHLPFQISQS